MSFFNPLTSTVSNLELCSLVDSSSLIDLLALTSFLFNIVDHVAAILALAIGIHGLVRVLALSGLLRGGQLVVTLAAHTLTAVLPSPVVAIYRIVLAALIRSAPSWSGILQVFQHCFPFVNLLRTGLQYLGRSVLDLLVLLLMLQLLYLRNLRILQLQILLVVNCSFFSNSKLGLRIKLI